MANDLKFLIEQTRNELSKLIGLPVSSTVNVVKDGTGWRISVEMVEKKSIPEQLDILALYEAHIDEEGNLLGFERTSLRKRMDTKKDDNE
jgi:hypothetical protein